ncbi:hypothetical protein [Rahnella sp. ChDrAdgB13]|uniref:hypothetical protein n=1 Tax=Rahnella sp. ChDrAdgB13 TaxID=1850581 RepID=UPI001AD87F30|nr:hypothetical protein [Rahnella sp. ChDrAdgB13]
MSEIIKETLKHYPTASDGSLIDKVIDYMQQSESLTPASRNPVLGWIKDAKNECGIEVKGPRHAGNTIRDYDLVIPEHLKFISGPEWESE